MTKKQHTEQNDLERIYASAYSIGSSLSSSNGNVTPLAPEWSEWELFDSCDDECALFLNVVAPKLVFGRCGFAWANFEVAATGGAAAAELVDGTAACRLTFLPAVNDNGCNIDDGVDVDDDKDGNGWFVRTFDLDGWAYKCDGSKCVWIGFVERGGGDEM